MSTPDECKTKGFSQTACGFVVEFADVITKHGMNDTATNKGGWPASSMREYLKNDIYMTVPMYCSGFATCHPEPQSVILNEVKDLK